MTARRVRFVLLVVASLIAHAHADYRHIELPNGDVYDGEFQNGKRNGRGTFTWADGNRYVGEYRDDEMQGKGTYYWPDGRTYEGGFVKDLRQGQGVLR
ncbi:MAG TPA: hypothetical protein VIZ30_06885, partial [Pseudomonadales bacterium]